MFLCILSDSDLSIAFCFSKISAVGSTFAKVYSGLKNSVVVQVSGVELIVSRTTTSWVVEIGKSLFSQFRLVNHYMDGCAVFQIHVCLALFLDSKGIQQQCV